MNYDIVITVHDLRFADRLIEAELDSSNSTKTSYLRLLYSHRDEVLRELRAYGNSIKTR